MRDRFVLEIISLLMNKFNLNFVKNESIILKFILKLIIFCNKVSRIMKNN